MANAPIKTSSREATTCLPGHEGRGKQREPTPDNRQPQRAEATGLHAERINHNVREEGYALLARPRGAREAARANPCQPPTITGWGDRTACAQQNERSVIFHPGKTERRAIFVLLAKRPPPTTKVEAIYIKSNCTILTEICKYRHDLSSTEVCAMPARPQRVREAKRDYP
jgi:hypothetical protein